MLFSSQNYLKMLRFEVTVYRAFPVLRCVRGGGEVEEKVRSMGV